MFSSLVVNNLSFRFPGRPLLLENSSLTVAKGELIAILGESGSGKSTFFQLIQRFYNPETGQINVNGDNWNKINTTTWRQAIGVVPQHITFFSGTLLDNICLGNTAEEVESIIRFCEQYGFSHYFDQFPQGYLTLLGEDGINLSGGQRQLVALARALYHSPQLLLLDEPTAAMDRHTEQFVLTLLERLRPQVSVLFITHKPTLARIADRIYSLESGLIQSISTHEQAALELALR